MKKLLCTIMLVLVGTIVKSQIAVDTNYFSLDTNTHYYYPKRGVHISEVVTNHLNIFKNNSNYSFQKGHEFVVEDKKYLRYDQYYNGIKINGNAYFVVAYRDTISKLGGRVVLDSLHSVGTVMTATSAVSQLTTSLGCFKYKWQDTLWENEIKEITGDVHATYYPNTSLQIFKNYGSSYSVIHDYFYAYPVYISALQSVNDSIYFDSLYYINPSTGAILKRLSILNSNELVKRKPSTGIEGTAEPINGQLPPPPACNNSCNSGAVNVHYYGSETINTSEFTYLLNCTNRLKNDCNGATIYTRKQANQGPPNDYRSSSNSWPSTPDKVGVTAHWCSEKVYEAYKNLFGFNSYDNAYSQLNLVVEPQTFGSGWVSNYSSVGPSIRIGKFQNTSSYQAVLDIVGHEFGHGVMNSTSGLGLNGMDLSSLPALNASAIENTLAEGFGDIFGQMVEYYTYYNYSTSTSNINDFAQGANNPSGSVAGQTRSAIDPFSTSNPNTIFGTNWHAALTLSDSPLTFLELTHQNSTILSHWFYLLSVGGTGVNDNSDSYCVLPIGQEKAGKIAFLAATSYIANQNRDYFGARLATIEAAKDLYGVGSNELAQVESAWYAVGVGSTYVGQINLQYLTVAGPINVNYNSELTLQNTALITGNLDVSSNTKVKLSSNVVIAPGATARFYITPACTGGARMASTYQNSSSEGDGEEVDLLGDFELSLYSVLPNPSSTEFNVIFNEDKKLPEDIVIIDLLGKPIIVISDPEYHTKFNLAHVPEGMYIMKVSYDDKTISKRLIKN